MARIRTLKPEMLDDEKVSALPHLAWRLFVSLIMTADDYGNQHGAPAKIRGSALWATNATDAEVREALARLSRDSLVALYSVRGQSYVSIVGWTKHQRVDKPGRPIVPGPEQADSGTSEDSRESREDPANPREVLATDLDQDQDQDHEGEGKRGPASPAALPLFGDPPAKPPAPPKADDVAALWAEQERLRPEVITGARGLDLTSDRRARIRALLKAGHSVDALMACVRAYAAEAKATGDGQWFNGESNWRPDNVARTLGRIGSRPNASASPPARRKFL
jgi:hypothetical protein